jgi:hypothetical protein
MRLQLLRDRIAEEKAKLDRDPMALNNVGACLRGILEFFGRDAHNHTIWELGLEGRFPYQ